MASNLTDRRVVVTGLGVVTPLGHDLETFWKNLISGQCGIGRITAFDAAAPVCAMLCGATSTAQPLQDS